MAVEFTEEELDVLQRELGRQYEQRVAVRDYWEEQGWAHQPEWDEEIRLLGRVIEKLREERARL